MNSRGCFLVYIGIHTNHQTPDDNNHQNDKIKHLLISATYPEAPLPNAVLLIKKEKRFLTTNIMFRIREFNNVPFTRGNLNQLFCRSPKELAQGGMP